MVVVAVLSNLELVPTVKAALSDRELVSREWSTTIVRASTGLLASRSIDPVGLVEGRTSLAPRSV
jgi:hypothetical protein